jgi:multicomponent Na+:H+ antiporter subunit D
LAYSTLAQVGFILVGIGWGTPLSLAAAIVFTVNHSLVKSALLMLAGALASRTAAKSAAFSVVTGLGKQVPQIGLLFFVGILALAGLPPTNGFISKFLLFDSGLNDARWVALAFLAVGSLVTFIYSMRAFQRIWWQPPDADIALKPTGDFLLAPAILIVIVIVFGTWTAPLIELSQQAVAWIGDPGAYIHLVLGS